LSVRFTSNKSQAIAEVQAAVARALETVGGTAERHVKEKIAQNKSVKTGNLRNSIAHEMRGTNAVAVGTNVQYAPYVEYGHNQQPGRYVPKLGKRLVASHVAAKPFLQPGIEEHKSEYEDIIKGELNV